jgi:hypothetical protein
MLGGVMKGKPFWKLSLLIYAFLLSPVLLAQERETARDDKSVLIEIGLLDTTKSNREIALITPASEETKPTETQIPVEAKVWLSGDELMLELTTPLPDRSERIRLDGDLQLGRLGEISCALGKGVYHVDYSDSRNGVVRLAVSESVSYHRRRRTKREFG